MTAATQPRRCDLDACPRPVRSRGLCNAHYKQACAAGTIEQHDLAHPEQRRPVEERFWANVDAGGVCWEWTGRKNDDGYGTFRNTYAHRWAWTTLVGPIPRRLTLDHLCRNRACCSPDHLEVVTASENSRRANAHKRAAEKCGRGHDLAVHGYIRPDNGCRICRACSNLRRRLAHARKAAA